MMKALVTGAAGQLGRALLANVPAGWDCRGVSRRDVDLADPGAVTGLVETERPDVLINAAAYTAVDRAEGEEALAFAVNATAVGIMADVLCSYGGHLVQISTDFVFDGTSAAAYQPGDTRQPLSLYGRSKAAGEDAAGASASVLRTAWVYGAGGANFVNTMLRLMRGAAPVRVVADQIGAPTWTGSLAKVTWALAEKRAPGTFHHSDAGVASWYDFAVAIQEESLALGLLEHQVPVIPITTADFPTPARRPAFSLLDSTATRDLLGIEQVHWRVNLRRMLAEQMALEPVSARWLECRGESGK